MLQRVPTLAEIVAQPPADILTMSEAAKMLRFSKAHLCHVLQGKVKGIPPLPHISIGRRKLFRRSALMDWLVAIERT